MILFRPGRQQPQALRPDAHGRFLNLQGGAGHDGIVSLDGTEEEWGDFECPDGCTCAMECEEVPEEEEDLGDKVEEAIEYIRWWQAYVSEAFSENFDECYEGLYEEEKDAGE